MAMEVSRRATGGIGRVEKKKREKERGLEVKKEEVYTGA